MEQLVRVLVVPTCNGADNQGVWYSFVATDPNMTVDIDLSILDVILVQPFILSLYIWNY